MKAGVYLAFLPSITFYSIVWKYIANSGTSFHTMFTSVSQLLNEIPNCSTLVRTSFHLASQLPGPPNGHSRLLYLMKRWYLTKINYLVTFSGGAVKAFKSLNYFLTGKSARSFAPFCFPTVTRIFSCSFSCAVWKVSQFFLAFLQICWCSVYQSNSLSNFASRAVRCSDVSPKLCKLVLRVLGPDEHTAGFSCRMSNTGLSSSIGLTKTVVLSGLK